jgi:hypothetical protein
VPRINPDPQPPFDDSHLKEIQGKQGMPCPVEQTLACANRKKPTGIGVKPRCRSYQCPSCYFWTRNEWAETIRLRMRCTIDPTGEVQRVFHARTESVSHTQSAKNRIAEADGQYVRVACGGDDLILASKPFPRSTPLAAHQAWAVFTCAVAAIQQPKLKSGTKCQPISASTGWKIVGNRGTGTHKLQARFKDPAKSHQFLKLMNWTVGAFDERTRLYDYEAPASWTVEEVGWGMQWAAALTLWPGWVEGSKAIDPEPYWAALHEAERPTHTKPFAPLSPDERHALGLGCDD